MPHTVTFQYGGTGEGLTIGFLYTMMNDPMEEAREAFGPFYASCAVAREGLHLDSSEARFLVPEPVRKMLADGGGHFAFHAVMHFNFS